MNNFIAFCGLDCAQCEARLATVRGDEALRRKVARDWSAQNGVEITPEMLHCSGCRVPGVKTPYCEALCPIRRCAVDKGLETCGACPDMDVCEKLGAITAHNAEARRRLEGRRMELQTPRLRLRRWEARDAEALYEAARDPDVGPIAGWPAHRSVAESRDVIAHVFQGPEAYAICLRPGDRPIGAIELKLRGRTDLTDRDDECELGYWLGKPHWGRGLMPEAVRELLRRAFQDLGMRRVWVGYYEGNDKSRRVQEKCGFRFQWKSEGVDVPLMGEKRSGYVSCLTREDWLAGQS